MDQWCRLKDCQANAEIRVRLIAKDFGRSPQDGALDASTIVVFDGSRIDVNYHGLVPLCHVHKQQQQHHSVTEDTRPAAVIMTKTRGNQGTVHRCIARCYVRAFRGHGPCKSRCGADCRCGRRPQCAPMTMPVQGRTTTTAAAAGSATDAYPAPYQQVGAQPSPSQQRLPRSSNHNTHNPICILPTHHHRNTHRLLVHCKRRQASHTTHRPLSHPIPLPPPCSHCTPHPPTPRLPTVTSSISPNTHIKVGIHRLKLGTGHPHLQLWDCHSTVGPTRWLAVASPTQCPSSTLGTLLRCRR